MEPNWHPRRIETILEQIKASFSSVYLTLTSIIQACVFGYLIFLLGTNWGGLSPASTTTIAIVTAFLVVITTWNEYMMGATAFRWIPRLKDAFIPFALGISEFLVIHNVFTNVYMWCYSLAVYSFIGYLAYVNMYCSARQHPENTTIFGLLGHLPIVTEVWAFTSTIIFIFLGVICQRFSSSLAVQYIAALCSLVILGGFLYRGVLYWNKIVGKFRRKSQI